MASRGHAAFGEKAMRAVTVSREEGCVEAGVNSGLQKTLVRRSVQKSLVSSAASSVARAPDRRAQ